ncbi:hypothetical protein BGZ70_001854 [Mortierella alpina]|uniref:BZIP domain-containing protein n=1 Tax=Mortierella alpina TaxID=64518 RepID=A0A9P6JBM4_MORAP|nr:hypothetical protein BGZ70_001854 [Mortierella alpina]
MTSYEDDSTVPPTTMSEAVNAVNAAIVAAVAAGDSTAGFSTEHIHRIENLDSMEGLDSSALESMVGDTRGHKRPHEDEDEDGDIEDSVKLRKLQEEVNNNANAAAQASGIVSNNTSLSSHTTPHASTHTSNQNSPGHSASVEAHVSGAADDESGQEESPAADSDTNMEASTSTDKQSQEPEHEPARVSPSVQEALAAATTHFTATAHSSIMADLERMQQLAKTDPAQLASYSTNPNNQATLEQLTSTAAGASRAARTAAGGHGILASMPAATENSNANDSGSSQDDDLVNDKRTSRNMTNDERRQRRLQRNRVAAKECRKKKKAYVSELQDTCTRLQEENARLYKEVEELNAKLTLGAMRIDENVRLIKEVEELNAKLTLGVMAGASAHTHVHEAASKLDESATDVGLDGSQAGENAQSHGSAAPQEVEATEA